MGQNAYPQNVLPILRSNSLEAYVKEGRNSKKEKWYIMPEVRPDVLITNKAWEPVTFYTEIDSVSFNIKPGKVYDFVILVSGKDSAYTQVKYRKSNLDILKDAWEYDYEDDRPLNNYNYKSFNHPDFVQLQEKFKLDSIAGKGNETSQIINILQWVNASFRYDGTQPIPSYKNIPDLMQKCLKNDKPLHCGAMAWVLKSCYLSMGLKARQVVCYPKDSTDIECHSTVAVFSDEHKKWFFTDPSHGVYITNENDEILSFEELREGLINNKDLKLNLSDESKTPFLKTQYLSDYLPKNFYAFECFSEHNGKSKSNLLLPVEYEGVFPHTRHNHPKCTNNPLVFWKSPS